jgi:hypothetical protein
MRSGIVMGIRPRDRREENEDIPERTVATMNQLSLVRELAEGL